MLALSKMHDHNFHSCPILLSNSPPHPHMHAPHASLNQDSFKHSTRLGSHIQGQQQTQYPAQAHERYSQLQPQSHQDLIGQYEVDTLQKTPQAMTYSSVWQYNNGLQQHQQQHLRQHDQQHQQQPHQHQSQQIVSDPSRHIAQNMSKNRNDQNEGDLYPNHDQSFSAPQLPYPHTSLVSNIDFEDVDEDDISDLEEEEELRRSYELYRNQLHRPDVTSRLLIFADVISTELRRYFGRTKDQEDACDVYEDKWATTKSGRELYYADLLRIAQGDMEPASKTVQKTSISSAASSSSFGSSSPSSSPKGEMDNRSTFKGMRDVTVGMGPLNELFEYGLKNTSTDKRGVHLSSSGAKSKEISQNKTSRQSKFPDMENKHCISCPVPMQERNLPESFWKEPGTSHPPLLSSSESQRLEIIQHSNMLASSRLPDFSDLVESWQGNAEAMEAVHNTQRLSLSLDQGGL